MRYRSYFFLPLVIVAPFFALGALRADAVDVEATPTDREKVFTQAALLAQKGSMKAHYRHGMDLFMNMHYQPAIPELIAATTMTDPRVYKYFYAEAYATLGVIYEFHRKEADHLEIAKFYYDLAFKYDRRTYSARYYYKSVLPKKHERIQL